MKNEERQSGIAPDKMTDLEKALEDILKRFEDAEIKQTILYST